MQGLLQALQVVSYLDPESHSKMFQAPAPEIKACLQCGATRTPQWREGPDGPKTLCNACGVKRCRQTRSATEGKKSATHPVLKANNLKAGRKAAANIKMQTDVHRKRTRSDPVDDTYAPVHKASRPHTPEMDTPTSSSSIARPVRRAAAKAASRTAEYAATGQWHDEIIQHASDGAELMTDSLEAPGAESADSMGRSSATAEELTWNPSPAPSAAEAVSPVSAIDNDSSAAIDLMAMSMRSPQSFKPLHRDAPDHSSQFDLGAVSLEQLRDHAEALVEEPELPIGKRLELQELLDALDLQEQQVVCADAAVSAVAKVLASKQSAATRAREAEHETGHKLHLYLASFLAKLGGSALPASH